MPVLLRALRVDDEQAVLAADAAMQGLGFRFAWSLDRSRPFADFVLSLEERREGRNVPAGWVPETFLVGDVGGVIVGRISLRHELNEQLRDIGGHIGFGVLPAYQRRGYATEMLRQALGIARGRGMPHVVVTCDDVNVGSRSVIERCNGVLTRVRAADHEHPAIRHYRIDLA